MTGRLLMTAILACALWGLATGPPEDAAAPRMPPPATTLWARGGVPARFHYWLRASMMPTPRATLQIQMKTCPDYVGTPRQKLVLGCTNGAVLWVTPGKPDQRYTFMHELAHVYDFNGALTDADRRRIQVLLRMPGRPWWGTGFDPEWETIPAEQYANAYADCATWGEAPDPVPGQGRKICATIRRLLR